MSNYKNSVNTKHADSEASRTTPPARSEEMLLLLGALQTSAWLVGGMAPVPATRGVTRSSSSLRMAVEAEYDLVIVGCGGALPQHESCP